MKFSAIHSWRVPSAPGLSRWKFAESKVWAESPELLRFSLHLGVNNLALGAVSAEGSGTAAIWGSVYCGRDPTHAGPPAQIRTCETIAYGSCLG